MLCSEPRALPRPARAKVDELPEECDEDHGGKRMLTAGAPSFEEYRKSHK